MWKWYEIGKAYVDPPPQNQVTVQRTDLFDPVDIAIVPEANPDVKILSIPTGTISAQFCIIVSDAPQLAAKNTAVSIDWTASAFVANGKQSADIGLEFPENTVVNWQACAAAVAEKQEDGR
jgi:hypothetical protein